MLTSHPKACVLSPVTCLKKKSFIFKFLITTSLVLIFKPLDKGPSIKGASPKQAMHSSCHVAEQLRRDQKLNRITPSWPCVMIPIPYTDKRKESSNIRTKENRMDLWLLYDWITLLKNVVIRCVMKNTSFPSVSFVLSSTPPSAA